MQVVGQLLSLNEKTWLQLGYIAELLNEPEKALFSYEGALRQNPYSEPTLLSLATLAKSMEKYTLAIEYLQRILKRNERHPCWGMLGDCFLALDDLQQAYSSYQQAYSINNQDPKLWFGIGLLYDRYGSLELARDAFYTVLKLQPEFEKRNEIHFRLAIIYKHMGMFPESLKELDAVTISPPSVDVILQRGHVYELLNQYDKAQESYDKVLALAPKNAKCLQHYGWMNHKAGKGFAQLNESLEADPNDPLTWYLLARCLMSQGKYAEAYDSYQQAVYRDGRNPLFWCSIGNLYYAINQPADALDAYSRSIRLNPRISQVWKNLGILYESCNNQIKDALDAYHHAIELDPHNESLSERIRILQEGKMPTPDKPLDINPEHFVRLLQIPVVPIDKKRSGTPQGPDTKKVKQ